MSNRANVIQREIAEFSKKLRVLYPDLSSKSKATIKYKTELINNSLKGTTFFMYDTEIRDLISNNIPMILGMVNKTNAKANANNRYIS